VPARAAFRLIAAYADRTGVRLAARHPDAP
jgi:hypothetical protein